MHQGYRSQSTSTGRQWTSGSGKETFCNMNEEIHTCFQVTKAEPWHWMCVCVCVRIHVGSCTTSPASQLYLFRHSVVTKAAVTLASSTRQRQTDQEKRYEAVRASVLNRTCWELHAWKPLGVGPTETSWRWRPGGGWTIEAERSLHGSCP